MIKKNCVICGKEFNARQINYIMCSDECRKKRCSDPAYLEKTREMKKIYKRNRAKIIPCKICGKPVEGKQGVIRIERKRYHEECVIKEAMKAISEGANCRDSRIRRADNIYGCTIAELRKMYEEGENNA